MTEPADIRLVYFLLGMSFGCWIMAIVVVVLT